MGHKIKLTDKDLELHITSSDYNVNYTQMPDTREPKCPTTTLTANCKDTFGIDCQDTFIDDCPLTADIECYDTNGIECFENTMWVTCPTATFRTVCLSKNPSCDCGGGGDTQGCQDTGNCANPQTYATQCGGCHTGICNQTNTCNCQDTYQCLDSKACAEPATSQSECHLCVSFDNCYISDDCGKTFPCAISEIDCDSISELANCETTVIKCTQPQY